jgi:hypothetical protein
VRIAKMNIVVLRIEKIVVAPIKPLYIFYLYYIKKSRSKIIPVKDDVAEVEIV